MIARRATTALALLGMLPIAPADARADGRFDSPMLSPEAAPR